MLTGTYGRFHLHSCKTKFNFGDWISCAKSLTLYLLVLSVDTFANSLQSDQARQNVGPDLDPNCLTL